MEKVKLIGGWESKLVNLKIIKLNIQWKKIIIKKFLF